MNRAAVLISSSLLTAGLLLTGCSQSSRVSLPFSQGQSGLPAAKPAGAAQTTTGALPPSRAADAAAPSVGPVSSSANQLPPIAPLIIKNGSLGIAVTDPESSLSLAAQIVAAGQGTITSQTTGTRNGAAYANLTIEVPPDNFETTMSKLRDLRAQGSKVLTDTISAQDVTDQYVDLQAQYKNLQATRDAYQALLAKATSVTDIITLTREIAGIQTQMDQIQGRENLLNRRAAHAIINLSLQPIEAAAGGAPGQLDPAQAASQAFAALLAGLRGLAVVLIWAGILLPVPALLLAGGWLAVRRATSHA